MAEVPGLEVTLCLNIDRPPGNEAAEQDLVRSFVDEFRAQKWPTGRLPPVYYDPRALRPGRVVSRLHAKSVVVDERWAFVTSANLTEAAQERNIEAGVLVDDPGFARSLASQFESLIRTGQIVRANPQE
jgi:phosphatidylserine/phosphatidylglycerophosphate/cardiolipin synthase-like enzyme